VLCVSTSEQRSCQDHKLWLPPIATALLVAGLICNLVDIWADFVCIHHLVLKPCSNAAHILDGESMKDLGGRVI